LKLTHKIYLLQFTLASILFYFLFFTYKSYEIEYKKDIDKYIKSEVDLYKRQIVSSISNATHTFSKNKKLYLKIHTTALDILKKDSNIDLETLRAKLQTKFQLEDTTIELFLIDKDYTIYKTTYPKDLGFNLSIVSEAKEFLDKTTLDAKIYISEFASIDALDMRYKLYSYSLLKKGVYLELGFTDDNTNNTLPSIIENTSNNSFQIQLYCISNNSKEWSYYNFSTKDDTLSKEKLFQNIKTFPIGKKYTDIILNTHLLGKETSITKENQITVFTPLFSQNMFSKIGYINLIMEIKIDIREKLEVLNHIYNIFLTSLLLISVFLVFVFIYIRNNFTKKIDTMISSINSKEEIKDISLLSKNDELSIVSKEYNNLFQSLHNEINNNHTLLLENKRFIADTVHQIRTPLTNIMMNSDMIKLTQKDDSATEYVEQINASISMLTNSYEDLSYILSNDTIEYKPTNVNISTLLNQRVSFFTTIAKVNHKQFIADIKENLTFSINPIELERLIDNNISNAIKYADINKPITIHLTTKDDRVSLSFHSYSKPIKNTSKLFEKDYRENESKRGLGLGLNMVKGICEKYNINYTVTYEDNQNIFTYIF